MRSRPGPWLVAVSAIATLCVALSAASASAQNEPSRTPVDEVVTNQITLPGEARGKVSTPQFVAATNDAVWVVSHRAGRMDRIDPATNQLVASVDLRAPGCTVFQCAQLDRIAADERNVWVYNTGQSVLTHIDAKTNQIVPACRRMAPSSTLR